MLASYSEEGLRNGVWRDKNELALFELTPYAEEGLIVIEAAGERAEALQREGELFAEYLNNMPRGEEIKKKLAEVQERIFDFLSAPRLPEDIASAAFISQLASLLDEQTAIAGEGPASGFRDSRMEQVARFLTGEGCGECVVLVDVLDYPRLMAKLPDAQGPAPGEPSRREAERAIMDRAWRLQEQDDWGALLAQLREISSSEAQYLASQIYMAAGQVEDALAILEEASRSDFSRPEYLPGYLLARLGQLYDVSGKRERAIRSYRAVAALSWAPQEAREIALAGLRAPFSPQVG